MIFFITVLRALAAVLITNAHYKGVYPTDLIANGGLLGDVLFFAVSGFVLANIKQSFGKWYKKRIFRIYPVIWVITGVYLLLGWYTFEQQNLIQYFIYPTYYHFIASIVLLYIPYYIIAKNETFSKNIVKIMGAVFCIQLVVYFFFYDTSYYHIDKVREPMIRFLFFESMLLGLYIRRNKEKFINRGKIKDWSILGSSLTLYFVSKLAFSRMHVWSSFQLLNQIILFVTLVYMMKVFAGMDELFEHLPVRIKKIITFIANRTLEIYAVQYVIIPRLSNVLFPFNWILITTGILVAAQCLHLIGNKISVLLEQILGINGGKKISLGEKE